MRKTKAEGLAILGLGISVALIVLLGVVLYLATERSRAIGARADSALQAVESLGQVSGNMGRAESAERAYVIYGEPALLTERDAALARSRAAAERLAAMPDAGFVAPERVALLGQLVRERARLMGRNADARRNEMLLGRPPQAKGAGRAVTERIYAVTSQLRDQALHAMRTWRAEEELGFRIVALMLLASAVVLSIVIVPAYVLFTREARSRRRIEANLRELAESLPGAVFQARVWPDGRFVYDFLSSSTLKVRGVEAQAALRDSRLMLATVVEQDRKAFREAIRHHGARLRPLDFDYRVVHPEKGVRWIRSVSAPSAQPDGSIRWSGHWDDVTTQKELEAGLLKAMEEAAAANDAKSRFLATVSHEIRTPMNGVLAMLEVLSLTRLDEEQSASLAIVRESGKSLLRIIDDILDFSKIEAGKMEVRPEPALVGDIVQRVANMYSGVASAKGLALTTYVDPSLARPLLLDPLRVQQILGNLANNAIKFTSQGGVAIGAYLAARGDGEDLVRLEVTDSGIGMTSDEQARVFDAFSQANDETTRRFGGTGLGLSISRQLTRLMDGTIEMRSRPGVGTEVRVTLPLAAAGEEAVAGAVVRAPNRAPPARREPPTVEGAAAAGRLVLVVDDHPINRTVLLKQVNALGFAAETAASGAEALEKWATGRHAILLLDCHMPEVNGYDVTRAIRQREASESRPRTPIVACTANAMPGETEKCLAAGMDDYLLKPVELAELASKLARWFHEAPLEGAALSDISGGDPALASEMLQRFRTYNDEDARELREAARGGRLDEVIERCHRIKGSSRTIGALGLADACERAERCGREGDGEGMARAMRDFERELARLEDYIESRTAKA